jgi:hypothetical protein
MSEPLCSQTGGDDEAENSDALALEAGQTLKRRGLPILPRQDSNRRIKVSEVPAVGSVDEEKKQPQPVIQGTMVMSNFVVKHH